MTEMRRVTVSIPECMDKRLLDLRKKESLARCSYSELVRRALALGLKSDTEAQEKHESKS